MHGQLYTDLCCVLKVLISITIVQERRKHPYTRVISPKTDTVFLAAFILRNLHLLMIVYSLQNQQSVYLINIAFCALLIMKRGSLNLSISVALKSVFITPTHQWDDRRFVRTMLHKLLQRGYSTISDNSKYLHFTYCGNMGLSCKLIVYIHTFENRSTPVRWP